MKKNQKEMDSVIDSLINLLINKKEICSIDFLENYPDMIVIISAEDGKYLDTNKKTQEMCRKTNKELKKMTIYDTSEAKWHKELDVFLKYARKYKKVLPYEKHNLNSDEEVFEFHVDGIVYKDNLLLWGVCSNSAS
jgi:hypothetical protein